MKPIQGICPIVATPFTPEGELDGDSLRSLLRALIEEGCHALTLFGIASEYYKLSDGERLAIARIAVEECLKAGVPSILSVTQHATALAVREALQWEEAGADCLMLLPPFFLKPSAAAVYEHALAVGRAVRLPIMLQYAPEQTGVGIPPEVLARLQGDSPNIHLFKIECKPPGAYITRLMTLCEEAKVFTGNAGFQMIESLDRGAIGVMPGCSLSRVYLSIYNAYKAGRRDEAVRIHGLLLPLLNHIRQDVEMIIHYEKRILRMSGKIEHDHCRLPGFSPDQTHDRLFEEYYHCLMESAAGAQAATESMVHG
ncbi:MAG: dihydrodipicolinate synthase family protein [Bryobacterales bacterium]|nr:dihydrodipicolinate synthase family protein [Bryobacterales bacterium]